MYRSVACLGLLVLTTGFAPVALEPSAVATSRPATNGDEPRRCFTSSQSYSIQRPGTAPVYIRVRTGQTLEIAADPACVEAPGLPSVTVRPLGPETANLCVGDSVRLDIESSAVIARTCAATVTRVVPEAEVATLSNRVRP